MKFVCRGYDLTQILATDFESRDTRLVHSKHLCDILPTIPKEVEVDKRKVLIVEFSLDESCDRCIITRRMRGHFPRINCILIGRYSCEHKYKTKQPFFTEMFRLGDDKTFSLCTCPNSTDTSLTQKRLTLAAILNNYTDIITPAMVMGIAGCGVVGSALGQKFKNAGLSTVCYDKFKEGYDDFKGLLQTQILFLCLPTPFKEEHTGYDTTALSEVLSLLSEAQYRGEVVIKSTVLPGTTARFQQRYANLRLIHNPEFLTARTAAEDSADPVQIITGASEPLHGISLVNVLYEFLHSRVPRSSSCSTTSEMVKLVCNAFYAVKVQFFNEVAMVCAEKKISYEAVINMVLKNGWVNPKHTRVPGPDGNLSYGGMCLIKDTLALNALLRESSCPNAIVQACVTEQRLLRPTETQLLKPVHPYTTFSVSGGDGSPEHRLTDAQLALTEEISDIWVRVQPGDKADVRIVFRGDKVFGIKTLYRLSRLRDSLDIPHFLYPSIRGRPRGRVTLVEGIETEELESPSAIAEQCLVRFEHRFPSHEVSAGVKHLLVF